MAQKPDDASNLQGSNDVYVRALTTQTGGQTQSNPVADARAKLQAQQSGNTGGSIRRLFGFAGGTSEVQAPSFWDQPPVAVWLRLPQRQSRRHLSTPVSGMRSGRRRRSLITASRCRARLTCST